jgi:hypothetical protein
MPLEMISVHSLKNKMCGNFYGSKYKVYRQFEVDKLLKIWSAINYLSELHTRTRLVPCNEEFKNKKAIPSYNSAVIRIQKEYPNILEIQRYKTIII